MKVLLIPDRYERNTLHKVDCSWVNSPKQDPSFRAKFVKVERKSEPHRRFGSCCKS